MSVVYAYRRIVPCPTKPISCGGNPPCLNCPSTGLDAQSVSYAGDIICFTFANALNADDKARLDEVMYQRGFEEITALPPAGEQYRGVEIPIFGGAGVRDSVYKCLKSDAGVYNWILITDGGA